MSAIFNTSQDLNTEHSTPFVFEISRAIFAGLLLLEILATVYDHVAVAEKSKHFSAKRKSSIFSIADKWLTSFSLLRNAQTLMETGRVASDIKTIHGIRMVNALLLLTAHKSMAVLFLPFANRTEAIEVSIGSFACSPCRWNFFSTWGVHTRCWEERPASTLTRSL